MSNTQDLSDFGYRGLDMAADLLKEYAKGEDARADIELGDGLKIEFNPNSGEVFFVDEDYNCVMLNPDTGKLANWHNCPVCGHEGYIEDMEHNIANQECQEYLQGIKERRS